MSARLRQLEAGGFGFALLLFGLLGWDVYAARTSPPEGPASAAEWRVLGERLRDEGRDQLADDRPWRYGSSQLGWWRVIVSSNWTGGSGKRPPPPGPGKRRRVETPLSDIIDLVAVAALGTDRARITIRYKDDPPNAFAEWFDFLAIGDTLMLPYDAIEFVRVNLSGPSAVFRRPTAEGEKEESLALSQLR